MEDMLMYIRIMMLLLIGHRRLDEREEGLQLGSIC